MDDEINSRFILFSPWGLLFLLLIIIIGNLFILDVALFWNQQPNEKSSSKVTTPTKSHEIQLSPTQGACDDQCKEEIIKEVSKSIKITTVNTTSTANTVKENFVTLGSGSSTASDWTDVPGAQSYIDSTSYGRIKSVAFEASLHTPTGNQTAYARLFNVTDQHPVWNSDVMIEGGSPQLKISQNITLDKGSKLYQVQMKTQLSHRTNLENARVHINTY